MLHVHVHLGMHCADVHIVLNYLWLTALLLCTLHLGTVMLNPNVLDSPSITIQYPEYPEGIPAYPDMAKIYELAGKEMSLVRWECTYLVIICTIVSVFLVYNTHLICSYN